MEPYVHKVQYYETDKMGVVHHSNYIRWMEEARVDYLSNVGWDYARLEKMGIISPVTAVSCKYVRSAKFPDDIRIFAEVNEFSGVKLKLKYTMKDREDNTVCEATSEHCFLDEKGVPIRMKKKYPELFEILSKASNSI